jgi:aminotransferase
VALETSARANAARTSPIRSMTVECARVGGVNLAQGVCDTPVPEPVRRAAQAAIEEGANSYSRSDGLPELRRALAAKMRRDNGLEYDPEGEIVVTTGATGAFYVACQGLLEPGDEVILFEPYYGYHRNTLESLGMVGVRAAARPRLRAAAGRARVALSPRTRAIVINTPGTRRARCSRARSSRRSARSRASATCSCSRTRSTSTSSSTAAARQPGARRVARAPSP